MSISERLASTPVLTTARLRLEPLGPSHFDGTWAALQDAETMRLTGTHTVFTEQAVRSWLEDWWTHPLRGPSSAPAPRGASLHTPTGVSQDYAWCTTASLTSRSTGSVPAETRSNCRAWISPE